MTGTITKWNKDKGYGFIRMDAGGRDAFFHISEFEGAPRPDSRVEVAEIEITDKGRRAYGVRPVRPNQGNLINAQGPSDRRMDAR